MLLQANTPMLSVFVILCLTFISSRCDDQSNQRGEIPRSANQIKMAVQPQCGTLSSDKFVNFNTGINLDQIKTIYSFGDSWTSNGNFKGGVPQPAVPKGTEPHYGGRACNGPMWTEDLASGGKTLKSYAIGGATIDRTVWKARATKTDMVGHVDTFLSQKISVEPESSLATIFYGLNDYSASLQGPGSFEEAVKQLFNQTERLISAGLKQFIVVSPPYTHEIVKQFDSSIWNGFKKLKESKNIEFAYVDLVALFDAIHADLNSFGYKSDQACLKSPDTTVGGCENPNEYLYWIPSHPQYQTQQLMADWVRTVLEKCHQPNSNRRKRANSSKLHL
ncbi:hypothetical protein PGT21_010166 [Puccinia graminis f. sp. tritici]|uniref:SGNH hydrolase-type esterase domain-containing protein n=1 Tax=Puccinia graminis f. sp. tritici TaxID=56615 RepID=A0A5B0P7U2_PUCGR|nr:hypothetical protein PGT21_010166 [Puccinia graminis f. sp. tritici]KAA1134109.1 hypothetical protein PGTUg99_026805 [Puccinia graminis f. sp. tritici]